MEAAGGYASVDISHLGHVASDAPPDVRQSAVFGSDDESGRVVREWFSFSHSFFVLSFLSLIVCAGIVFRRVPEYPFSGVVLFWIVGILGVYSYVFVGPRQ